MKDFTRLTLTQSIGQLVCQSINHNLLIKLRNLYVAYAAKVWRSLINAVAGWITVFHFVTIVAWLQLVVWFAGMRCRPDNRQLLSVSVLLSLGVIVVSVSQSAEFHRVIVVFVIGVLFVYCYRAANASLLFPLIYADSVVSQSVTWHLLTYKLVQRFTTGDQICPTGFT